MVNYNRSEQVGGTIIPPVVKTTSYGETEWPQLLDTAREALDGITVINGTAILRGDAEDLYIEYTHEYTIAVSEWDYAEQHGFDDELRETVRDNSFSYKVINPAPRGPFRNVPLDITTLNTRYETFVGCMQEVFSRLDQRASALTSEANKELLHSLLDDFKTAALLVSDGATKELAFPKGQAPDHIDILRHTGSCPQVFQYIPKHRSGRAGTKTRAPCYDLFSPNQPAVFGQGFANARDRFQKTYQRLLQSASGVTPP